MYPPAPAGLSREQHIARSSLKSRQSVLLVVLLETVIQLAICVVHNRRVAQTV